MIQANQLINGLTLILATLVALLALIVAMEWRNYQTQDIEQSYIQGAQISGQEKMTAATQGAEIEHPKIDQFREIIERPLFIEGRQPEEDVPVVVQQTQIEPLSLRLEGVVKSGDANVALLRDTTTNGLMRLSPGMRYKDWQVKEVDSEQVVMLRGESEEMVILLRPDKDDKSTTQPRRVDPRFRTRHPISR